MRIAKGSYRSTFLIWKFAFKVPRFTEAFAGRLYTFYNGLIQNRTERAYSKFDPVLFCPVWFSLFGFINVMPRCTPVGQKFAANWWESAKKTSSNWWMVEPKASSVGLLPDGRAVAIDYGSTTISQQDGGRDGLIKSRIYISE